MPPRLFSSKDRQPERDKSKRRLAFRETSSVRLTAFEYLCWPFSSVIRLKKRLGSSENKPVSTENIVKLQKAISRVNLSKIRPAKLDAARALVKKSLSFVCSGCLSLGDLAEASDALRVLAERFPSSPEVRSHRISLMERLVFRGDTKRTSTELGLLLRDPKISTDKPMLPALDLIYRNAGRDGCARVLAAACAEVNKLTHVRAVADLCNCPSNFKNGEEASVWAKLLDPERFHFSRTMQLNARITQIRCAEWRDDTDMKVIANLALQYVAEGENSQLVYWIIRAQLYDDAPLSYCPKQNPHQSDERWRRLFLAVDLHQKANPEAADALFKEFEKASSSIADELEVRLFLRLAQKALVPSISGDIQQLAMRAEVCRLIRKLTNPLAARSDCSPELRAAWQQASGWVATNIAVDLLINKFDYASALVEIQQPECAREELALPLRQIAGLLTDKYQETKGLTPSAAALLEAKEFMFQDGQNCSPVRIDALIKTLKAQLSDKFVIAIPGLKRSINCLIALLSSIVGKKEDSSNRLMEFSGNRITPSWIRCLALRFLLLSLPAAVKVSEMLLKSQQSFSVSVALMTWIGSYAPPIIVSIQRKQILEHQKNCPKLLCAFGWNDLLDHYHPNASSTFSPDDLLQAINKQPDLEDTIKTMIQRDVELAVGCQEARRKSVKGENNKAKQNFKDLLKKANSSNLVTRIWWEPIALYWLSVADAMLGNDTEASAGFHSLLEGPKALEAKGQLALLALKKQKLEEAEGWLGTDEVGFPGVLYAKALLAWRRGEQVSAEGLLESFDRLFGSACTHYRLACLRLLASIRELTSRTQDAIDLLTSVRKISPFDAVSGIRLARLITQDAYHNYAIRHIAVSDGISPLPSVKELLSSTTAKSREQHCSQLLRLLSAGREQLQEESLNWIPQGYAWYQLLLRRMLEEGCAKPAVRLLRNGSSINQLTNSPSYFRKSHFILLSWHFLKNLYRAFASINGNNKDDSKVDFSDFGWILPVFPVPLSRDTDSETLLQCIQAIAQASSDLHGIPEDDINLLTWAGSFAKSVWLKQVPQVDSAASFDMQSLQLISAIYKLCYEPDKTNNHQLVEQVLQLSQVESLPLTDVQRNLAAALARWKTNDLDGFLDQITFDNGDEPLPFADEHLWLAKATVWFKKSMFTSIFESEMPEAVADLSNHDACLLFAKTSSRQALESWRKGNARGALLHIRQAENTLRNLTEPK